MKHNNLYCSQSNAQDSCYGSTIDPYNYNNYNSITSSSYVDCTLSLGTPSTRSDTNQNSKIHSSKKIGSKVSIFNWGLFQQIPSSNTTKLNKNGRVSNGGGNGVSLGTRRCASCDTTSTPLWRNGPKGPKSLCNACGIRYKKEERRASAAASANTNVSGASMMESSEHYY